MKTTVKDAIADILVQEKIEYVFGYTGGHIVHMRQAAVEADIKLGSRLDNLALKVIF